MITIKLNEMLKKRGRTLYWLATTAGIPHNTLRNMSKKETQKRIDLTVVSRMCAALDCMPGDFFDFVPDSEDEAISALAKSKDEKVGKGAGVKEKRRSGRTKTPK
jgi:putative transcriptional regulator